MAMDSDNIVGTVAALAVGIGAASTFSADLTTIIVSTIEAMVHAPMTPKFWAALNGVVQTAITVTVQAVATHYTPRKNWSEAERTAKTGEGPSVPTQPGA